ncbi:MAG TPA: hypothetical protein VFM02_00065 [Candidatus Paceibacterota bacterium]|nr:hypothetical protein [Candidatus Paceibacterota bacterium]
MYHERSHHNGSATVGFLANLQNFHPSDSFNLEFEALSVNIRAFGGGANCYETAVLSLKKKSAFHFFPPGCVSFIKISYLNVLEKRRLRFGAVPSMIRTMKSIILREIIPGGKWEAEFSDGESAKIFSSRIEAVLFAGKWCDQNRPAKMRVLGVSQAEKPQPEKSVLSTGTLSRSV